MGGACDSLCLYAPGSQRLGLLLLVFLNRFSCMGTGAGVYLKKRTSFPWVQESQMNNRMIGIGLKIRSLMASEKGQDLVEYSMAFSAVALGTVAGMTSVATAVAAVFATVTTILANAI